MKKTIVFIQNVDFPQPGAVDIFYYAKFLSREKDIRVKVIVSWIIEDISNENLEIIELGKINHIQFILQALIKIKKIKSKNKIDYVYFFAQHPFSVFLQFFIKYFLNIKTIYDVVSGPIGSGIIPFIAKLTIKLGVFISDKYVILDKGLIQKLGISWKKSHIIMPMGYDEEKFFPNTNANLITKKENEIIFTYIGTINTERNLDIFIQAFIEVVKENKSIKLYFIGEGTGEEKLRLIAGNKLNKNIFFMGKKEHEIIPGYINSSDILISYVPKIDYFEYQPPTKLIEYLACNKPTIATNTVAQQEILINFQYLIHKDNIRSTKKQIKYCIENISTLENNNYKKEVEKYKWEKLIRNFKEFL